MANEFSSKVQIEVGVKETGNSVKSIKTELREAKAEAIAMARAFGENSTQAVAAAKKVANLTDEVEDLGIRMKGVNPDKFARIATMVTGLSQGFVAAQGAMALFGGQSEALEKTMIKLQGAIALSQGLQGIKDLSLTFAGLGAVIRTQVVTAFATLKAAIISTGIGALIVSIGAVILYFKNMGDAAVEAAEKQKQLRDETLATAQQISELNLTDFEREKALAVARAKEAGRSESEIYEIEHEFRQKKIKELKEVRDATAVDSKERIKANKAVLQAQAEDEIASLNFDEAAKKRKAESDKQALQQRIEAIRKAEEDRRKAFEESQKKIVADDAFNTEQDKQRANERAEWNKVQTELAIAEEKRLIDEVARLQAEADQKAEQRRRDAEKAEKDTYDLRYNAAVTGLQAISDIYSAFAGQSEEAQKRAFNVQKAANVATTIIDTYTAAQKAYASQLIVGDPTSIVRAQIAAGVSVAAGLARLAKIKATTFNSSSPSTTSIGTSTVAPPTISQTPQQQREQSGFTTGSTGTKQQTNLVKVFVTETDISARQKRSRDIERKAIVR